MESGADYIAASKDDTREAACKYPEQTNTETDDTRRHRKDADIESSDSHMVHIVTMMWTKLIQDPHNRRLPHLAD